MNNKEKRKSERYEISEYIKEEYYKDIRIEINTDSACKLEVIDISMSGLGFAIEESGSSINLDEFDRMNNCFINIYFAGKVILAEVKKVWSIIIEDAGRRILKGGFVFSMMSPEDRLYLSEYIILKRN